MKDLTSRRTRMFVVRQHAHGSGSRLLSRLVRDMPSVLNTPCALEAMQGLQTSVFPGCFTNTFVDG